MVIFKNGSAKLTDKFTETIKKEIGRSINQVIDLETKIVHTSKGDYKPLFLKA